MRLMSLRAFRAMVYCPDSAPSLRTLRERIDDIPGGCVQLGRYYVDMDVYDAQGHLRRQTEQAIAALRQDPVLEGLL